MPLTPPDLSRPYASPADKDADWQLLLRRAETLQDLTRLTGIPEAEWPAEEAGRLRAAPPIAGETAGQRLTRWRNVFASELADLERAVLAASSQGGAGPSRTLTSAVRSTLPGGFLRRFMTSRSTRSPR